MTRAGAGGKTSQVLHQVCLVSPATMAMTPCSLFLSACIVQFLSKRATLRVGHSPLGCKDHKANVTITTVMASENNNIGDRGAVALTDAVQALHITVFLGSSAQSVGFSTVYTEDTHVLLRARCVGGDVPNQFFFFLKKRKNDDAKQFFW